MKMNAAAHIRFGMTVAELRKIIADIPDHAIVDLYVGQKDRPWDAVPKEIKFSWTTKD